MGEAWKNAHDRTFFTEKTLKESERGSVCLVRDAASGERYIQRTLVGGAEVYRKIKNAAPPHIPGIESVTERDGKTYVLEEYIQGDTLAFLMESEAIAPDAAKDIIIQLCEALEVLHCLGVVHRDIKPENVILRGSEAVLIDFDVSRICKPELRSDTQVMGTAGYAAPEQYGFSQTDGRADIYALGVMLNEMLTKQHPSKHLTESAFRPIVEKCIEVNADKRYGSAAQLRSAIEKTDVRSNTAKKKKPLRLILPLCFLALLIVGGVVFFGEHGEAEMPPVETPTEEIQIEMPVSAPMPSPSPVPPPTPTTTPTPAPTPIQSSAEVWPGEPGDSGTWFNYDLNGDGQSEEYYFAPAMWIQANGENRFELCAWDSFFRPIHPGEVKCRGIVAAVWRYNGEGRPEMVPEFSDLLQGASVTLWRVDNTDAEAPLVFAWEDHGPGAVEVYYLKDHGGTWLYDVGAELDGNVLHATGLSNLREP